MSDIFISYAREDRGNAQGLAAVLEAQGWTVWWDRSIPPGRSFDQVIEEALTGAKCVVVLWSHASTASDWVKTEAAEGLARKILVPVRIEEVNLPLEFRRLQTVDLSRWKGDRGDPELRQFLEAIAALLRSELAPTTPSAPRRDWRKPALFAAAALAVAILGWSVFQFASRSSKSKPVVPTRSSDTSTPAPSAEPVADLVRSPQLGLEFWQHDKECPMFIIDYATSKSRVVLKPGPFEIRCPRFKGSLQICAWIDDSIFAEIAAGRKLEDVTYLSPGTGMADSAVGTPRLQLENQAHNELDESRRRPISERQDSIYISSLLQGETALSDWPTLYLVVFADLDQNSAITTDEFDRIVLEFKR
jgi:hypothetical protein